ncbi:MBOAT family O-acyltransferase [Lysobacter enzymogenes]|uniref:MBOAT family O-acyltransferase n=1 Tax=Lysobacter enzymogenes TaxID=69 RepID=UPI00099C1211|nr:MBOAT family O-acyltransferase [Lysobacter enzymogenes]UZW59075.1 MBOAT family protein [Lysobacter enzymogenes]
MVFSSPAFLFVFFPLFFGLYFLLPRALRNAWILLSSVLFYALGAGPFTLLPLGLVAANWALSHLIERLRDRRIGALPADRLALWLGVAMNLIPLLLFKYLVFFAQIAADFLGPMAAFDPAKLGWILPLGISFYSFHFISYLVDVYQRHIPAERSVAKFAIYIFLFPHLVAGPIVRFAEIKSQLGIERRGLVGRDVYWGLLIFIVGLAKKILIADPLGSVVDVVHSGDLHLSTYSAWLAALCYSFQIYFDFSGYTDMAIGMARMMGFRFPQNFDRPYTSHSVTEFWRRWHMTLSRWFRDYLYIPLGGNRGSAQRTYFNLLVIFVLCGLWHGAAYTFLVWGLGHGLLLVLERAKLLRLQNLPAANLWVFALVTLLWVPFRSKDLATTGKLLKAMFGLEPSVPLWVEANRMLANPKILFLLALAALICLIGRPTFDKLRSFSFKTPALMPVYCAALYFLACISVVESGFNPFIYFQF